MPASRRTPWLICYDIADPSRLQQVHRTVSSCAFPFQYSAYWLNANRKEMVRRMRRVEPLIDPRRDDVRAYPLLTSASHTAYGRPRLSKGVLLSAVPGLFFDNAPVPIRPLRRLTTSQPRGQVHKGQRPLQLVGKHE